jgi:hypothetical protein
LEVFGAGEKTVIRVPHVSSSRYVSMPRAVVRRLLLCVLAGYEGDWTRNAVLAIGEKVSLNLKFQVPCFDPVFFP